MATLLPCGQSCIVLSPFSGRNRTYNTFLHRNQQDGFTRYQSSKICSRGSLSVARLGFNSGFLPDPDGAEEAMRGLFGRVEGLVYTIADAALSSSDTVATTTAPAKQSDDWFSGITNYMETVLKVLKGGLSTLHVPYAYGFAIIFLTVLVKAVTFPLTKKQVESAMAMRSLQPQIKAIQKQYAGDQERIQLETARLYKLAGINPLAGCLPTLATIPVWIGLYRALSNVADEGLLTEGFFWIPSLAGPTTVAARQNGSGISWLFPFVDGHPPLGWPDTLAYLVLPVLLVLAQYISIQIMQSSQANDDPNLKTSQALTKVLPLMIGYFSLSVPSGLSLYWLTNNILSTAQQVWLQKLGGAQNPVNPISSNTVDQDQMKGQKTVPTLNSSDVEAKSGNEVTSQGPRPGERFRQLKEEEARRRKQREEEKMKAEETAATVSMANVGYERAETRMIEESGSVASSLGTTTLNTVNGNLSGRILDEQKNDSSAVGMGHDNFSNNDDAGGRSGKDSTQSLDKETVEVYTSRSSSEKQLSKEEAR